jgi:hypothetical protein
MIRMLYELLRFGHFVGLSLIAAGLIGVFLADIRTQQAKTLPVFAQAVRNIALFYHGLVVPGALLVLGSGTWMIIEFYGGWASWKSLGWRAWCCSSPSSSSKATLSPASTSCAFAG